MKVLLLIDSLDIGGAETHVYDLAVGLKRLGVEVCVASGGGRISDRLCNFGIRQIKMSFQTRSPFKFLDAYFRLLSFVKKEKFDIIHAHSRRAAYIAERISRRQNICFITTVHARFSATPIKKYMSRWGYYVSAVSEDLEKYLGEFYGISPERVRIIPNAVDTERFSPRADKPKERSKVITFVSRLDADCSAAAYALCKMAERLSTRYGKINIRIIGGGSEYSAMRHTAKHMNRLVGYECIEMLGAIEDVSGVLKESDVFVGVSRAALEAMSCGVNTVLAGNEGFFGIVSSENISIAAEDNFCGREHGKFSSERLFESICEILDMSVDQYEKNAISLRAYVCANHSADNCTNKTLELYKFANSSLCFSSGDACICGYYGFGNVGDDTLLCEAIKRCKREIGDRITAFTKSPAKDRYTFGVRCIGRKNIFAIFKEMHNSKRLVFGGGTLFQDRTSLRSLMYYLAIAKIASMNSVKVELWGNGLGEINSPIGKRLLKKALNRASYIGLRDKHSYEYALSLGVSKEKLFLENDLSHLTLPIDSLRVRDIMRKSNLSEYSPRVLISISGACNALEYKIISDIVMHSKEEGALVVILDMYPSEDSKISEKISEEFGCRRVFGLCAGEIVYLCQNATLCVSMRLHALIFSKLGGCNFIGVGDDPKIRAFCEENGGLFI